MIAFYSNTGRSEWLEIKLSENNELTIIQTNFHYRSGFIAEHCHLQSDETFEIVSGIANYYVSGKKFTAYAGEQIVIPKGVYHKNPYNADHKTLIVKVVKPNQDIVDFFHEYYKMAETEAFVVNIDALPTNYQLIKLNRVMRNKTVFKPTLIERVLNFIGIK